MTRDPLVAAFDRLADRKPEAALVLSQSNLVTIGEVDRAARSVERSLREAGIEPGTPVGLVAPNGPGFLVALVAGLRLGSVPILIDARMTDSEADRALERLGASGTLRCVAAWPDGPGDFRIERRSAAVGDVRAVSQPGVIKLTSGSTGEPRGILSSIPALLADGEALTGVMGIRSNDRLLTTVPLSHSYGLSVLVVPALTRGTPLVVPESTGTFAPLDAARRCEATLFPTVPAYLAALLRVAETPPLADSVRRIVSAGARLMPAVAARIRERFGRCVNVFYGASECGGIAYDPTGFAAERETVGVPVPGVSLELRAVDDVATDRYRRIVVRSPAVAETYLPDRGRNVGDGVFVSDDLGTLRGEELALVGRLGQLINVRGNKVNPAEVERVISEMTVVDEVEVLGVVNEETGDEIVSAVVACRAGAASPEQIRAWCRERLSGFKLPRIIHVLERIPRNERGKVDRGQLARLTGSALPRRTNH